MTILLFLGGTVGAAALALLLRPLPGAAFVVGLGGLVAALVLAALIEPGAALRLGDVGLVATDYARVILVLAAASALVTFVLGRADEEPPSHAPAALAVLGAIGAALVVDDPLLGLLLIVGAGIAGLLASLGADTPTADSVAAASRSLRLIAGAGTVTIVAAAWLARPLGALALEPAVFGIAYLGMVGGVALRAGVIPFHLWLARLADSVPPAALPITAVWIPVALAVVVLGWVDRTIAPLLVPLETERAALVAVGFASLLLGALASSLADDLVHVAVYVTVGQAGIVVLGLTVLDPTVWQPLRSWLGAFALAQTALFAWVAAARVGVGSRRVEVVAGRLVEGRLLGLGFGLVVLAGVGLPGWPAWQARERILELVVGPELAPAAAWLGLIPFLGYLRLAVAAGRYRRTVGGAADPGLRRRAGALRAAPTGWFLRSSGRGLGAAGAEAARRLGEVVRARRFGRAIEGQWRARRAGVAAVGAVVLALLAVGASAGWFGIDEAAAGGPPTLEEPPELIGGGAGGPGGPGETSLGGAEQLGGLP